MGYCSTAAYSVAPQKLMSSRPDRMHLPFSRRNGGRERHVWGSAANGSGAAVHLSGLRPSKRISNLVRDCASDRGHEGKRWRRGALEVVAKEPVVPSSSAPRARNAGSGGANLNTTAAIVSSTSLLARSLVGWLVSPFFWPSVFLRRLNCRHLLLLCRTLSYRRCGQERGRRAKGLGGARRSFWMVVKTRPRRLLDALPYVLDLVLA
jgi:hypothetical protein